MQFRVPQEEVIMVRSHADEVFGSCSLVQSHQTVRIPFVRLPKRDDILVAVGRWMSVMLQVIFILRMTLLVHLSRIPIPVHRHSLGPPMRPYPEFGITK